LAPYVILKFTHGPPNLRYNAAVFYFNALIKVGNTASTKSRAPVEYKRPCSCYFH